MEIVKKRKRRLLAWILIMTLGICMWQSNVFANEGIGDSNLEEPASVSDNTIENEDGGANSDNTEELTSTPYCLRIIFGQVEETEDGLPTPMNVEFSSKPTTSLNEWSEGDSGDSGGSYYEAEIAPDTQVLSGITFTGVISNTDYSGEVFAHNVLNWWYWNSDKQLNCINNGSSELDLSFVEKNIESREVYANLGDSIIFRFVDETGITYAKEIKAVQSDGDEWNITLPQCEILNKETGEFFTKWDVESDGKTYNGSYDSFEKVINISPIYSNFVSDGGSYSLIAGKEYKLGEGTWEGSDGYSYIGEANGSTFFVETNCSITFN